MPENYLAAFQNKRLNEVIIPGSHDAGIYGEGKQNVITQKLDIEGQAMAGVRWFDLRIAIQKSGFGPWAKYEQRAYHLDQSLVRNESHFIRRHLPGGDKSVKSHQNVSHLGGWGDSLQAMIAQARVFLGAHKTEFLIFKFSKSYGLDQIVETCVDELGEYQYNPRARVNLNMMQVKQFGGKVITLFPEKELAKLGLNNQNHRYSGCLPFRELYNKKSNSVSAYDRYYNGLQYFGKFSSTNKITKNTEKQRATLELGAMGADRDAMGMMYWTTTDFKGSIRERNKQMWTGPNQIALEQTWKHGLQEAIRSQMGRDFQNARNNASGKTAKWGGGIWKAFMPNVVMMDFASPRKCQTVYQLNHVVGQEIANYVDTFGFLLGDD
jgi:hypothetical protein